MFISAIVMVLLLSFLPLLPALLSNITMGNYRRIQLANLNGLVLVAVVNTNLGGGAFTHRSGHYDTSEIQRYIEIL